MAKSSPDGTSASSVCSGSVSHLNDDHKYEDMMDSELQEFQTDSERYIPQKMKQ